MRTTVELEDEIFKIIKSMAREQRKSFGAVLSKICRDSLVRNVKTVAKRKNHFPLFEINHPGAIITNDIIDKIKDEEELRSLSFIKGIHSPCHDNIQVSATN